MTTKNNIFDRYLGEYLKADKQRKSEILNNVCDVVQTHRKAAIRKFKKLQMTRGSDPEKRGRRTYYTPDVSVALRTVWKSGSEICGELLHPMIPEYVMIFQRDNMWSHSENTTVKLLEMSEATTKRRVAEFMKSRISRKGKSATSPSNLKEIIPIFTGPWTPDCYGTMRAIRTPKLVRSTMQFWTYRNLMSALVPPTGIEPVV